MSKVLFIVGSLRQGSFNHQLAEQAEKALAGKAEFHILITKMYHSSTKTSKVLLQLLLLRFVKKFWPLMPSGFSHLSTTGLFQE